MAHVTGDRVKEASTTTGTGTITLAGALSNFRAFSAIAGNGDTFYYAMVHRTIAEWEVGVGTYNSSGSGSITRGVIISSSNGGGMVTFSAGVKDIFCVVPAVGGVRANSIASGQIGTSHLDVTLTAEIDSKEDTANKGQSSGYASLDSNTILEQKIQFLRAGLLSGRPASGIAGQIYFSTDSGRCSIWNP